MGGFVAARTERLVRHRRPRLPHRGGTRRGLQPVGTSSSWPAATSTDRHQTGRRPHRGCAPGAPWPSRLDAGHSRENLRGGRKESTPGDAAECRRLEHQVAHVRWSPRSACGRATSWYWPRHDPEDSGPGKLRRSTSVTLVNPKKFRGPRMVRIVRMFRRFVDSRSCHGHTDECIDLPLNGDADMGGQLPTERDAAARRRRGSTALWEKTPRRYGGRSGNS